MTDNKEQMTFSKSIAYDFPRHLKNWKGIALVGEAPGADEVKQGHPFVGRSGQLLNKVLAEAGIERQDCLVANVFRFQPPGNKVDHFFISRRKAKQEDVSIAEQLGSFGSSYCRSIFATEIDNLSQTLKDLKPAVIVSLGRTPLWALTGESGLLKKVGKELPCRLVPGLCVIPTFHPSFIVRGNWGLQEEWSEHLRMANQRVSKGQHG